MIYVLLPAILSAILSFINPFVGLFAIFSLVEILVVFCIDINAKIRIGMGKNSQNTTRASLLKKQGTYLAAFELAISVIFTLILTIINLFVFLLASGAFTGVVTVMSPIHLITQADIGTGYILLGLSIFFQIVSMIMACFRRKQLSK